MTVSIISKGVGAPAVRWEPCAEFHDDADDGTTEGGGVCAGCGWPPDDHQLAAAA